MRNKKYVKQLLSIVMIGLLSLNEPMIALAESEALLTSELPAQVVDVIDADDTAGEATDYEEVTADEFVDEPQEVAGSEDEELFQDGTEDAQTDLYDGETMVQDADASEFPTEILAGDTYKLEKDITLSNGQQIKNLAGTLDGQGHTITLSGSALAVNVSGTIQNLGVKGSVTVSEDHKGVIADTLTGTLRNSYSVVGIKDDGFMSEVGGLVGKMTGGTIQNCYFAGSGDSYMMVHGIASYNNSAESKVSNCYFINSLDAFGINKPELQQTNCASKTDAEMKSEGIVALLNTAIAGTGYVFAYAEGSYPVLKEGVAEVSWAALDSALEQAGVSK